jgi:hypothetical protein
MHPSKGVEIIDTSKLITQEPEPEPGPGKKKRRQPEFAQVIHAALLTRCHASRQTPNPTRSDSADSSTCAKTDRFRASGNEMRRARTMAT